MKQACGIGGGRGGEGVPPGRGQGLEEDNVAKQGLSGEQLDSAKTHLCTTNDVQNLTK